MIDDGLNDTYIDAKYIEKLKSERKKRILMRALFAGAVYLSD